MHILVFSSISLYLFNRYSIRFSRSVRITLRQREVCRHHGLSNNTISNHGPQFISHFWKHLWAGLKISCKLSSAYHPQTDGQTERT